MTITAHARLSFAVVGLAALIACAGTDPAKDRPPAVIAGVDQSVSGGDSVTLSGGLTTDPDGDNLTFTWRQLAGPAVAPISPWTMTFVTLRFLAPTTPGDQALRFELKASDGELSGFDTVDVLVHNPIPPTDPCKDPNVKKVNITISVTFADTGNFARYVDFDGFRCGTTVPWATDVQIWNGGLPTYTTTGPIAVNYPNGSGAHTIRAYWWNTAYVNYNTDASDWITPSQLTINGVQLNQQTAPLPGFPQACGIAPDGTPRDTPTCHPHPYLTFFIDGSGVVYP